MTPAEARKATYQKFMKDYLRTVAAIDPAWWEHVIRINLLGTFHAVRAALPTMRARNAGSIITTSGGGAYFPELGLEATAYASAKAGVEYATKIAAVEYGDAGVRFNTIAASLIETPMTADIFAFEPMIQAVRELTPLGRMGDSKDIANAALYLCSDLGSYVTGQTLNVDGGSSLLALPTGQVYADVGRRWQESQGAT